MKKFSLVKKRSRERCMRASVAAFILMSIVGTSFGVGTVPVHAQSSVQPVAEVATNLWTNLITTIEQTAGTISEIAQELKDIGLDGIAWYIAKFALAQIQKETVNWINSGFDGSPAFVTDLGGFLAKNADEVAGEFIYGSQLNALCSPFQLNIRIALSVKYLQKERPARCTLSGVVGNVENFLAGSFAEGGLPGWFELTVNPNNNFFGASASAESALLKAQGAKKEVDLHKLLFGKGFLGKEVCQDRDDGQEVCKTVTPGDTISESLNRALGLGEESLLAADEIDEIISALFQQLAIQALKGANGLLGTSERGSDGRPAYLDQINNPQYDRLPGQNTLGTHFIETAITDESAFNALYANIVSTADALFARITALEALDGTETEDGRWECQSFDGIRAQVTDIKEPALVIRIKSDGNLATLRDLDTRYKATKQNAPYSSEAAEANLDIMETFTDLQRSGVLHRASQIPEEKRKTDPIVARLATLANQAETMCRFVPKESGGDNEGGGGDGGGD